MRTLHGIDELESLTDQHLGVGSRLRGSVEVGKVERLPNDGAQVTWRVPVELEGSDKPPATPRPSR